MLPEGWAEDYYSDDHTDEDEVYRHTDGREQSDNPGKPEGIIAIANAIPGMRALTKLDISNNDIGQGGSLQLIIEVCDTKSIKLDNHESESDDDY